MTCLLSCSSTLRIYSPQHFLCVQLVRKGNILLLSQETEWKTRGLERLEAIKSELQQWQGISQHPPPSATDTAAFVPFPEATRQCIERTQQQWTSIHDRNQSNLQKATLADRRVGHLLQQCEAHGRVSHRLEATQQEALSLQTQCDALTHMATQLHETLIGLEEQIQQRWTEKRQRDYTLWQQQQTSDLLREEKEREQRLVQKEAQLRATWEEHSQQQKKERIALYDATFQAELEEYRHKRETQVDSLYSGESHLKSQKVIVVY
ncbi:hypothetical protein BDF14DRAFT_689716 [Spinellus fusiger]|nr:hypothetical protein BDF14DRAFT_689716 [Spinellus fusiger]